MRKIAMVVAWVLAVAATTWAGSANAAEALLIRHEVLRVPIGSELHLQPGFFIGRARTADRHVAMAEMDESLRSVSLRTTSPGRTIVSTWSLREPHKRIEYEIVVEEPAVASSPTLEPILVNVDELPPVAPPDATN